jgi:hypothetical protein
MYREFNSYRMVKKQILLQDISCNWFNWMIKRLSIPSTTMENIFKFEDGCLLGGCAM